MEELISRYHLLATPAVLVALLAGSLGGGILSVVALILLSPVLAKVAPMFGSREIFLAALLGIVLVVIAHRGQTFAAGSLAAFGILLATLGLEPVRYTQRFTFGFDFLNSGVDLIEENALELAPLGVRDNGTDIGMALKPKPLSAAGNSVVLKPAETASVTLIRLAELALKAGRPAGVLNIVTGSGPVGRRLLEYAARSIWTRR